MPDEAIPILRVADAAAALPWYERLGYTKEWEHRFGPGLPAFVSLARGGQARLFLSEHRGDARPDTLVYLRVDDVDDVAREFDVPIRDQPWGREAHLVDPDGNRLRVASPSPWRPTATVSSGGATRGLPGREEGQEDGGLRAN